MADVRVKIDDAATQEYLRTHGPRKVQNALRSAIRTTTTWAEKTLDQRLAADTEIPISVFKRVRVKKKVLGGGPGRVESGRIWSGYNPIKARFVGEMYENSDGAVAGSYLFPKAFIATMRKTSGLTAIFKRRGPKRLPIVEQKVNIPQAAAIAAQVGAEAGQEALRRFRAKFSEN